MDLVDSVTNADSNTHPEQVVQHVRFVTITPTGSRVNLETSADTFTTKHPRELEHHHGMNHQDKK